MNQTKSMFWLFGILSFSKKFDIALSVKYSSSCNNNPGSFVYVDNDSKVKGIYNQTNYVRLSPGTHSITVSHPWCSFYPATITVEENGFATAVINGTRYTKQPFPIRHQKLVDPTDQLFSFATLQPMIMMFGGMFLMKKFCCNPEKINQMQQRVLEQQQQLAKEQEELNNKKATLTAKKAKVQKKNKKKDD